MTTETLAPPVTSPTGRGRPGLATGAPARELAAITVLALVVRLFRLDATPLWRDEAFSGLLARRPWGQMLDAVRHDSAPPLAYLLEHAVALVSTSPVALRLISVLAGTAAVPLAAALARRAGGDRAARFAALLAALGPAFVMGSRDARMYSLAGALVLASVLALWRAMERPSPGRLVVYGVSVCLCLYTDYFTALAVGAELLAAAVALRPGRRVALATLAAAAGALPLIPWLVAASAQFQHAGAPFWVVPFAPGDLWSVAIQFLGGPSVDPGTPHRLPLELLQVLSFAAAMAAAVALLHGLRSAPRDRRRAAGYLAGCGLFALGLLLMISIRRPLFETRYASTEWLPLVPLLGTGLARLRRPAPAPAALLAVTTAATIALATAVARPDVPGAAAVLRGRVHSGDAVAVNGPRDYLTLLYYGDPATRARAHLVAGSVPWYWGTAAYPPDAVVPTIPPSPGTVWVVGDPADAPLPVPAGLVEHSRWCGFALCVTGYGR